jgi:predicted transcriptional regulator
MHPWGTNGASTSSRRRDKLYIVAEILEIVKEGVLKTQIMYRANLSFTQLNEYLRFMIRNELIEKSLLNDKDIYKATEKGLNFLQRYREITELLKEENDSIKNNVKIPPPHLLKRN